MSGNEEEGAVAAFVEALQGPWVWIDPATGESVPYAPEMTAQRLLDSLKANGYTVVELPKPIGPDGDGQLYFGDYDIRVDNTGGSRVGDVWTDYGLGSEVLSQIGAFRARYMGTALLAAAAAAERNSEER